jgi:hypothetical protein
MKALLSTAVAAAVVIAGTGGALAQGKSADAPGQDRTCLVTSSNGSFNDDDVATTKWLPRKAAEAQASKDPTNMRVFDYQDDPLVKDGTYASAEELCNEHFVD